MSSCPTIPPNPPPLPPRRQLNHAKDIFQQTTIDTPNQPTINPSPGPSNLSSDDHHLHPSLSQSPSIHSDSPKPIQPLHLLQTDLLDDFCFPSSPEEQVNSPAAERNPSAKREEERLEEIDQLEVDEFLRRSCKYLDEVEIQITELNETTPPPLPKLSEFRRSNQHSPQWTSIDWIGFLDALLLSQLERYCPYALRSSPTPPAVSITQVRAQATRAYVTIFPELQRSFSTNQITHIYRWENPSRTAIYLSVYYILWFTDCIPAFVVGYALYKLISRHLNPPTVSQLRQEVKQRHQLGKQAEAMGSEGLFGTKTGTKGSIAKGVMANSIAFAGIAVGANPYPTTNENPVVPTTTNKTSTNPTSPKIMGYRGLYALSRGVYTDYGLEIQNFLTDLADISEKIRNLYLWRRPHACRRTTLMLMGIFMYTLMISQKWIVKIFLGWVGIEFFFVFQFTDKNPKFRKVLNPIWLLLYEIPTDSEFALQILQERGKSNKLLIPTVKKIKNRHCHNHSKSNDSHKKSKSAHSISSDLTFGFDSSDHQSIHTTSKSLKHESLNISDRSAFRSVLGTDNLKQLGHKVIRGGNEAMKLVKRTYEGDESNQSKNSSLDLDRSESSHATNLSTGCTLSCTRLETFATLCGKVPGNLIVNEETICFEPMKGFRSKTLNIKTSLNAATNGGKGTKKTKILSTSLSKTNDEDILKNDSIINEQDEVTLNEKQRIDHHHHRFHRNKKQSITKVVSNDLEEEIQDQVKNLESYNLIIPLTQISKIKKIKKSLLFGVGFRISDGIEFYLDNSSVISFDNIINRDQYFNHLVIILSHH